MNEQLQNALLAIINKANDGIDAGVSFLSDQIPDVIHQLLVWKAVSSLLTQGICILIVAALVAIAVRGLKGRGPLNSAGSQFSRERPLYPKAGWMWDKDGDLGPAGVCFCVIAFILSLCTVPIVLSSFDWLQIWIAPKIYLIEYAASLAKPF